MKHGLFAFKLRLFDFKHGYLDFKYRLFDFKHELLDFKYGLFDHKENYHFSEVNNGETQVFNIDESVIWNPELDGIKEFVNVISFGPTQSKLNMKICHFLD